MVQVGNKSGYSQTQLAQILAQRAEASSSQKTDSKTYKPKGREVHDTVELSGGAKQINLARGFDLAEQVRNEKDPEKVRQMVKDGTADITRIGTLFSEVAKSIRAMFKNIRFGA